MTRRLFNLLTAVSLLLCVAAVALWARGPAGMRTYEFRNVAGKGCVGYDAGGVAVAYREDRRAGPTASSPVSWDWPAATRDGGPWAAAGFLQGTVNANRQVPILSGVAVLGRLFQTPSPARYVKVPWWSLVLLTAAAPTIGLGRAVRLRRRRRRGLCLRCGYDLRATPGRCPECGHRPAAAATAVARAS
jgi:hypothetical protein